MTAVLGCHPNIFPHASHRATVYVPSNDAESADRLAQRATLPAGD